MKYGLPDHASFLASIIESSEDAILSKDLNGIITSWNKGAERLFGYTAEEAIGKPVTMLIPTDRLDEEPAIIERIRRGEPTDHFETVRQRKDGSLIDISLTVSPIRTLDGTIIGASKIARNISERKRAQERQAFLTRELQHRTMNLFTVIQSVVRRTLADTRGRAKDVLNARLRALAQAYSMLADAAWEGAPLDDIIKRELAGFSDHVSISGCDIVLNAQAVQQFALIAHELATNAAKYGALSVPSGSISIEGKIERVNDHGTFSFLWTETGGPAVVAPKRKGFGSSILFDSAKHFGDSVKLDYDPQGVRYEFRVPLRTIETTRNNTAAANISSP
ncbi:MAG: PAS domain S-box protein [Pseudolabrys sp.]|nr:PAS domain S-box protein [Pseudolabrys sp.]